MDYKLEVVVLPVSDVDRVPDHQSYGSFFSFGDLDANRWFVQEITTRRRGR